jgi:hypothetical protein
MVAPDAKKAARFASAETVRWIEEATVSYQSFLLGATVLLLAGVVIATARIPRVIGYLLILGGIAYLMVGWVVGQHGFAPAGALPSSVARYVQLTGASACSLSHGAFADRGCRRQLMINTTVAPDHSGSLGLFVLERRLVSCRLRPACAAPGIGAGD